MQTQTQTTTTTRLFLGNIPHAATELDISQWVEATAQCRVPTAQVVRDRATGHSRGFAFVTIESDEPSHVVKQRLWNQRMNGRKITVGDAKPRGPKPVPAFYDDRPDQ